MSELWYLVWFDAFTRLFGSQHVFMFPAQRRSVWGVVRPIPTSSQSTWPGVILALQSTRKRTQVYLTNNTETALDGQLSRVRIGPASDGKRPPNRHRCHMCRTPSSEYIYTVAPHTDSTGIHTQSLPAADTPIVSVEKNARFSRTDHQSTTFVSSSITDSDKHALSTQQQKRNEQHFPQEMTTSRTRTRTQRKHHNLTHAQQVYVAGKTRIQKLSATRTR